MLNIPGYAHPMTLSECVEEARWQAKVARTLRNVPYLAATSSVLAVRYEREAARLMYAAREYKRGVKLVEDTEKKLGKL